MAAVPARLAEEYGSRALWRARLDGELEVATVRDGYLYRRLVNENGTTTLIDSAPPPPGYRWSFPTVCAGFAVCMAALIGVAIHGRLEFVAPRPAFLPFIVGMAVMGIGWLPVFFAEAVEQRVKHLSSWMSVWHEATQLNGWAPRTSAQRACGWSDSPTITMGSRRSETSGRPRSTFSSRGWCRRKSYQVDQAGRTELVESTRQGKKDIAAQAVEVRTKEPEPDPG